MSSNKHKIKRRLALTSFYTILLTLAILLSTLFWGDEATPKNMQASSGIIIMILGCLTTIIGSYLGLAHLSDMKETENDRKT